MRILAIDPGTTESAQVSLDTGTMQIEWHSILPNMELLEAIKLIQSDDILAIEMMACQGKPVGKEVLETCVWIGRYQQVWEKKFALIYRHEEKSALCGSQRVKDPHIRQALIDLFGPGKDKAIGTKKAPGPLYGIHDDEWSALAVAVTYAHKVGVLF